MTIIQKIAVLIGICYISELIGQDILNKYQKIKYTIRMKKIDKKVREYDKKNNNSI